MLKFIMVVALFLVILISSSCVNLNLNINVVHTQGEADDVVDDTDDLSNSPKVDTSVQVPLHTM